MSKFSAQLSFLLFILSIFVASCNESRIKFSTKSPLEMKAKQIVQQQLEAYNNRDIEAFSALFSEDAQVLQFPDNKILAQGKANVKELYKKLFDNSPTLHSELVNRTVLGNRVIDHEKITGRAGVDVLELAVVYEIEQGKISKCLVIRQKTD